MEGDAGRSHCWIVVILEEGFGQRKSIVYHCYVALWEVIDMSNNFN